MRVNRVLAILVVPLAIGWRVDGADKPVQRGNLVKNPGFAQGLEHWTVEPEGKTPLAAPQIDQAVSHGADATSLKFVAETGKRVRVYQAALHRDPRVKKYRFAVWARCERLSTDWILRVGVESWRGSARVRTFQNRHEPCGDDPDWQPTIFEFEPPEETEQMAVYVGLWFDNSPKATPPRGGGTLWVDDVVLAPVVEGGADATPVGEPTPSSVAVEAFYPLGERGVFTPGQPIQLALKVHNRESAPAAIRADVAVKDFFDVPASRKAVEFQAGSSAASEHHFELDSPGRLGFFAVSAKVTRGGAPLGEPATGFCVIRPAEDRDPFFGMDPNGFHDDLLGAYRIIGVGSLGIHQGWSLGPDPSRDLVQYMRNQVETRWAAVWKSDFAIVGYVKIDPEFHARHIREETAARRQKGLFPYPDDLFIGLGEAVEAEALAMRDRVKTWVIQEEIDAWARNPNAPAGSGACELARHVLMTRIAHGRLKKVDPDCTVAALGVCMDYKGDPPFQLVRSILPDLKGHFDLIGLDPYCEAYQLGKNRVLGPEGAGLRQVLLDTQKLQAECGKAKSVLIAEKGLSVPYHVPPDHAWEKTFAHLTARNLIVAKSVQPAVFYSHYLGVSNGLPLRAKAEGKISTDDDPLSDFGIWKQTTDGRALFYQPRAAVAAYSTVAHLLANATEPEELNVRPGFFAFLFRRNDAAVAVLWTTQKRPYRIRIELPGPAVAWDLMGNGRDLPAGVAELEVSCSPIFLTSKVSPAAIAAAVRKTVFPSP